MCGVYGGYILVYEFVNIISGDIIFVLEGFISFVEGIEDEEFVKCELWICIWDVVKEVLDSIMFEDLVNYFDDD